METATDTRTSDVDTTLREKLVGKIMSAVDFSMYVAHANNWDVDQREKHAREVEAKLLDEILAEFHQLMNEKREAIEGMKEVAHQSDGEFRRNRIAIKNDTLDDVLSILKD